jgi:hypothetical protein
MTLLARQTGSRASPKSTARSYLCTMSDSGHQEPGEAAIPRAGRRRLTRRDARVVLRNEQRGRSVDVARSRAAQHAGDCRVASLLAMTLAVGTPAETLAGGPLIPLCVRR